MRKRPNRSEEKGVLKERERIVLRKSPAIEETGNRQMRRKESREVLFVLTAVAPIAHKGKASGGKLYPDLVRAPGFQMEVNEAVPAARFHRLKFRHGFVSDARAAFHLMPRL